MIPTPKLSFKQQQLRLREKTILDVVNRLLAAKGFDMMTMDEVAAEVGIAKASLYKHFDSKEAVAAASMTRVLEETLAVMMALPATLSEVDKLKHVVRWAIKTHLDGNMPSLPSTRSTIRKSLMESEPYLAALAQVTEKLGEWIQGAQGNGSLTSRVPAEVILLTIYARSCDPVADFLQIGGAFTDDEIVEHLISTTFDGIAP